MTFWRRFWWYVRKNCNTEFRNIFYTSERWTQN